MLKNKLKSKLDNSLDDTANPMDGVSNMSDAMLVLAVGIMLALVINWNVDLHVVYNGSNSETVKEELLQDLNLNEEQQNKEISLEEIENKYKKTGTVYTDVYTGKTYVIVEE